MPLDPERLAQPGTEHAHQVALFAWIAQDGVRKWPALQWAHAIPNGGARDVPTAGRLRAEGVKAGVFDIFVPVAVNGWHGMYLEMKKLGRQSERRGGLSDAQFTFGIAMHQQRYYTAVAYTWVDARNALCSYMEGRV